MEEVKETPKVEEKVEKEEVKKPAPKKKPAKPKVVEEEIQEIQIDTGLIKFNLRDKTTKEFYGTIAFNPTDFNILKRFDEARKNIIEAQKEFEEEDVDLKEDGTPFETSNSIIKSVDKLNKLICEQIDFIFDSDISNTVFGNKSPLALIKGKLFFENFMNSVHPIIEKEINNQIVETEKRTSKYTSKYNKKR